MWNPTTEVLTFLVFAIVLNTVVFGGITLAYFLDKHRVDPPREVASSAGARTRWTAPPDRRRSRPARAPRAAAQPARAHRHA